MTIEDLTKAMWMLNADLLSAFVDVISITEGKIFLANGQVMAVQDLVQAYNEEYGE